HGKRVVLMRDMTDCMYNPQRWPYVDHFSGNDLMIAHVERFVCPTITSDQLLGGEPFRSKYDKRAVTEPRVEAANAPPDWFPISLERASPLAALWAKDDRGPLWCRCVVRLPKDWLGQNRLQLRLEASGRVRAWLNGQESNTSEATGQNVIAYQFPSGAIITDDANLFVLRIERPDGSLMLPDPPVLASGGQSLS